MLCWHFVLYCAFCFYYFFVFVLLLYFAFFFLTFFALFCFNCFCLLGFGDIFVLLHHFLFLFCLCVCVCVCVLFFSSIFFFFCGLLILAPSESPVYCLKSAFSHQSIVSIMSAICPASAFHVH